jgi:hypothetical protein
MECVSEFLCSMEWIAYFYGCNAGHDSPLLQGHFSASEALAVRALSKESVEDNGTWKWDLGNR